ncbi:uncharacterized protein LOC130722743 [Lotus japonicus]|uniref:uncharacterized protein LOC130722743 n=1 Tax=Lotus japonicus TaxID=34305 RepID=UPI002589C374|nr:uncharacterized protein LOC130722743 [Lotus japonicus]
MEATWEDEELHSMSEGDDDDVIVRNRSMRFHDEDMRAEFNFRVGMEFISLEEFKVAAKDHAVLTGREIYFPKNDTTRVRAACKKDCKWVMLCSKVGGRQTFAIKTLSGPHTCARVFNNKNATSKFVAKKLVEKLRGSRTMRLNDVVDEMRLGFSTGITRYRAWKGRQLALQIVEGDASKQYTLLYKFSAELRRVCAGNTCKMQLENPAGSIQPRFGRFYMCLEGCKRGFLQGCRPFIGLDGCHLKTMYGGILLCAVARDPNDQNFPLAFAVVESECKESWQWFLDLLLLDIGPDRRWIFISDQQKGLLSCLEGFEHRFCLRHLYANFKKRFGGGVVIRNIMMAAAKATYRQQWEAKMLELREQNNAAWEWMMGIPTRTWCKHDFTFYPKCDVLMNNLSESFNSTILLARDKPILTMMDWIRTYLMGRFATLREKFHKYRGEVMPKPLRRLAWETDKASHWFPTMSSEWRFEVKHIVSGEGFVVDLSKSSCTCNLFDLVGIPCRHAVAAIACKRMKPEDFVHPYYKRAAYEATYGHEITPINGQELWQPTNDPEILPPIKKRGPGRPKKLRRRDPFEDLGSTRLSRTVAKHKCSRCGQHGHNSRRCPNPVESQEPEAGQGSEPGQDPVAAGQGSQPVETQEDASQVINATQDANIQFDEIPAMLREQWDQDMARLHYVHGAGPSNVGGGSGSAGGSAAVQEEPSQVVQALQSQVTK